MRRSRREVIAATHRILSERIHDLVDGMHRVFTGLLLHRRVSIAGERLGTRCGLPPRHRSRVRACFITPRGPTTSDSPKYGRLATSRAQRSRLTRPTTQRHARLSHVLRTGTDQFRLR